MVYFFCRSCWWAIWDVLNTYLSLNIIFPSIEFLKISMVIGRRVGTAYYFVWRTLSWSIVGLMLRLEGRISWWCLSTWSSPMISKGWFYWFHLPRCGTAGAYPHPSSDLLLCRVISTPTGNPSYRLRLWRGRLPCRNQMISTSISWWGVRSI